ncbi:hypothetical protein WDW37_09170 [Bdellovibrionota bacterium FG-1]
MEKQSTTPTVPMLPAYSLIGSLNEALESLHISDTKAVAQKLLSELQEKLDANPLGTI